MKWIRTRQQHNYRMVLKSIKDDFSRYTSAVQKMKKKMDQVLHVTLTIS